VTAPNFDSIYEYLLDLYRLEVGSGMYHVNTDGFNLKVIDLETNNLVPDYQEIISEEEGICEPIEPPIMTRLFAGLETDVCDPYTNLISCFSFRDIDGIPDFIPYELILSDLKSKFAEYGWNYDDLERNLK
jgi:hypothetical protein